MQVALAAELGPGMTQGMRISRRDLQLEALLHWLPDNSENYNDYDLILSMK